MNSYVADLLALLGFSAIGYGLYLYDVRVALVVCGILLLVGGAKLGRSS